MILFHGSNVVVDSPLVNIGRKELDFGPGFYLTKIVEGGVANDQVIDTVEDYFSGRITAEQAIGQLQFAQPTHQICISNQDIVDRFLHFEGYEPLK